jgi:acetate kinase
MYCRRVRQIVGAYAVTLGGVDAVVFTAGVGEHAADIRREICQGLELLGLQLDPTANAACRPDADIAAEASPGRILVVAAREDLSMLHDVLQVLGDAAQ